jgi:rhamnulokinase
MTRQAHLALDLGAESGRAMLGVLDGDRLDLHEVHRFANGPRRLPSGLHWNVPSLWDGVLEGVRRGVDRAGAEGAPLASAGVDTWGVDYALVGAGDELLTLPRCYRDERNEPAFRRVVAEVGEETLYAATGIQLMAINTLYQLRAQADADPSLLAAARRLLFIPDLFHLLLTGASVTEASIASTSQMVDHATGAWATDLLDRVGLPTHLLGPIAPAPARVGPLADRVTDAAGGAGTMVIAPAAHDTASAVAAVPATGAGWCYLSSGTWSLLGAELDAPCVSDAARRAPFTNEAGVNGTTRFLKVMSGLWLVQELRRDLAAAGEDHDYARLTEMAAAAPPFVTLVDPADPAFVAPGAMRAKIDRFARETGQPVPATAGAYVRCALESLALAYRRTIDQLEAVLDRRFDVVHVVGGGARNRLLDQMVADATGRRVVAGPVEATAAGNVLVQAMGTGTVRDLAHARRIVAASFEPETFEPRDPSAWETPLARSLDLLDRPRSAERHAPTT